MNQKNIFNEEELHELEVQYARLRYQDTLRELEHLLEVVDHVERQLRDLERQVVGFPPGP